MGRMVMEFFTFRMRRRMSDQRPRAAERPSADDDKMVEDLVPPVCGSREPALCSLVSAFSTSGISDANVAVGRS